MAFLCQKCRGQALLVRNKIFLSSWSDSDRISVPKRFYHFTALRSRMTLECLLSLVEIMHTSVASRIGSNDKRIIYMADKRMFDKLTKLTVLATIKLEEKQ